MNIQCVYSGKFSYSFYFQVIFVFRVTVCGLKLRCKSRLGPRRKGPECIIPYRVKGELHLECTLRFRPQTQSLERSLIAVPLCPIKYQTYWSIYIIIKKILTWRTLKPILLVFFNMCLLDVRSNETLILLCLCTN